MPWRSATIMSQRKEFIMLSQTKQINFSALCKRFGVSRKTGYKWLGRYNREGASGLQDRSRRPAKIARHIEPAVEEAIVSLRIAHPTWGARKIRKRLQAVSKGSVPACSTITGVFHRHDLSNPQNPQGRKDWQRFEHPASNCLWQMDFKGPVTTLTGRCHPLTVLDDHSRFNLCLAAKPDQKTQTVKTALTDTFRRYGLPDTILVDNGSPWGSDAEHPYTPLGLWIMRLGVRVSHSRPYHPQTLGKDERFHRTLKQDILITRQWLDIHQLQRGLDAWRHVYNFERPHEALDLNVPASRYKPSSRPFPENLPPMEYPSGAFVRKVQQGGEFSFKGRYFKISKCFSGYPIGIMPTTTDGVFDVLFSSHKVADIDLRT